MERIDGNFLTELFAPQKSGDVKPIADGGAAGNHALYLRANQEFDQAATRFGVNDKNQPTGNAKETFWVSKPAAAEKLGETLLRENFGFEEIDVQSYKKLHGEFTVFDEKQCAATAEAGESCRPATAKQIQNWQTSADGKKVAVNLPEATVKFLRDFRQQRLIERRAGDIADPELRARLENDLKAVATGSGETRAAALTNLRNILEDDSPDGKKAAAVVKFVAGLPENRENPFTLVLLAKIELKEIYSDKTAMFNPNDVKAIERRIDRAVDSASGYSDATKLRDPQKAVSRREAQALNEEAARLAEGFGKPADARFRTLLARFYAVDDTERGKFEVLKSPEWTTVPRLQTNAAAAMSPVSKESIALERFRRDNSPQTTKKELAEDPQKRVWRTDYLRNEKGEKVLGKDGKPIEVPASRYNVEGSMRQQNTTYKVETRYGKNGEEINNPNLPYSYSQQSTVKTKDEGAEMNTARTTKAFVTAGAVALIEDINKWTPFLLDLHRGTTAKKIAMGEKLEKAEFDANNFPVPPKPEKIQRMKRDLIAHRFETQADFERVQLTMKRLEDLSYAFWNR